MKKAFKSLQARFVTKEYSVLFIETILVFAAIYLLGSLVTGGKLLTSIFFLNTEDAFMDFFNSIRDAAQGVKAYTDRHVIYPPMANLIFYLLSFLSPDKYNNTRFVLRYRWKLYDETVQMITVFVIVCVILLFFTLFKSLSKNLSLKRRLLLVLVAVGSVPCLNLLERGNLLIVSLIFLLIYAMTYHSKSRLLRELGLIALALSFSLKLYPVLFAWILIGDKRYKEFIRCAIYCLATLILPSFAFGGPAILLTIAQNIFSFSSGSGGAQGAISSFLHVPSWVVSGLLYLLFLLCALTFVAAPFVHRERWKVWTVGCIAFIAFPSLTSIYAWLLFLIPLIFLFNEKASGKENLRYFLPILIPFLFFPIPIAGPVTANIVLVYPALIALTVFAVKDTWKALQACRQEKKVPLEDCHE